MRLATQKLLWLLLCIASIQASSQHVDHAWAVGGGLSYRDFSNIPEGNWSDFDFEQAYQISFRRYLTPSFDIGISGSISNFSTEIAPEELEIQDIIDADINLRFKFNNGRILPERFIIAPYLLGGLGLSFFAQSPITYNPKVPVGLGFRIQPTSFLAIDINAQYQVTDIRAFRKQNFASINAGIAINFGKPAKQDTPEEDLPPPSLSPDLDYDGDLIADKDDRCPYFAGPAIYGGCPDTDQDSLSDIDDTCPMEAGPVALGGCPDSDQDGIADVDDSCPDEAGLIHLRGCPDKDNDGIPDTWDKCPDDYGEELAGCPDADDDGIPDNQDECPNEAGVSLYKGCPSYRDSVGMAPDAVLDGDDEQSGEEENPDKEAQPESDDFEDEEGEGQESDLREEDGQEEYPVEIPEKRPEFEPEEEDEKDFEDLPGNDDKKEEVPESDQEDGDPFRDPDPSEKEQGQEEVEVEDEALSYVLFDTDQARLKPESFKSLNLIADFMRLNPDYKLRIIGRADPVGREARNQGLSVRRARACAQHLIRRGVSRFRLEIIGLGENVPLRNEGNSDNQINRRVDFEFFLD